MARSRREDDGNVLLLALVVEQAFGLARAGESDGADDLGLAHAVERSLLLIDDESVLRLIVLDIPVHVDDAVGPLHDLANLLRDRDVARVVRAVNLGDERLEHRRARGHLRHLHTGAEAGRDGRDGLAHPLGDGVALRFAFSLVDEVDLDVGDVRAPAQKVVTDQAVEVVGSRGPHVRLVVRHLRLRANGVGEGLRHAVGLLEGRAFGHVYDNLELALVVEGEHLDAHPLHRDERHRAEQENDDAPKERRSKAGNAQERSHHAAVEAREGALRSRPRRRARA